MTMPLLFERPSTSFIDDVPVPSDCVKCEKASCIYVHTFPVRFRFNNAINNERHSGENSRISRALPRTFFAPGRQKLRGPSSGNGLQLFNENFKFNGGKRACGKFRRNLNGRPVIVEIYDLRRSTDHFSRHFLATKIYFNELYKYCRCNRYLCDKPHQYRDFGNTLREIIR